MDHPPPKVTGTVWLIGAGPGAADLLTVRAARLIAGSDLIVHDGLVGSEVLALARPNAERISVAKQRGRHNMRQEDINALMIAAARAGRDVVRLKGGDPFIFGRGGEEMLACRAAGVPVAIVPGISAAMACAADAGMPLTHRGISSAVSFVAGQCRDLTDQDWTGLAGHGRTLVIYMGVATGPAIADKLMAGGLDPAHPVAVIERGGHSDCRILRSVLADLGGTIDRHSVSSPALIVIGAVAALTLTDDAVSQWWAGAEMGA